jgi:hypothetical protein
MNGAGMIKKFVLAPRRCELRLWECHVEEVAQGTPACGLTLHQTEKAVQRGKCHSEVSHHSVGSLNPIQAFYQAELRPDVRGRGSCAVPGCLASGICALRSRPCRNFS